MVEPGWYVDYQNPKQMRYHDGTVWTEHVHADGRTHSPESMAATPPMPAIPPTPGKPPTPGASEGQTSALSNLLGLGVIGLFVGVMFGGFLFNGIGSITPVTEYPGTVERIEIEYSRSSGTLDRGTYVLSGSTEGAGDWRIVDEDAYRVLDAEGYPQDVVVAIGDWSDSAERVVGASFTVDHQSTGARIGWGVALGVIAFAGLVGAVFIGRAKSGGIWGALGFLIAFFGPGTWLGYQAFQWAQSV